MLPAGRQVHDVVRPEELFTIGYRDNVSARACERIVVFNPSERLKNLASTLRAEKLNSRAVQQPLGF